MQDNADLDLATRLAEIQKKLDLELKIREGTESLKNNIQNQNHLQLANVSLENTNERINYLVAQLHKLRTGNFLSRTFSSENFNTSQVFEYYKQKSDLSFEKIVFKLIEAEYKLSVENCIKEGLDKMLLGGIFDKKKALETLEKSKQKINLLKSIVKKYSSLDTSQNTLSERSSLNLNATRNDLVSGLLKVKIKEATGLPASSGYCSIDIDNVTRAKTKLKKRLNWDEEFLISVYKGNELEIALYDDQENLVSILYFRLCLLVQDSDDCFEMEPAGSLNLSVSFEKQDEKRFSQIGRKPVIKRKFHSYFGHTFVATQFYQMLKCAVCDEFILTLTAYQCLACNFTCHKKCHIKTPVECFRTRDATKNKMNNRTNFSIPHRFETSSSLKPIWCIQCGQMLAFGKKSIRQCSECEKSCHEKCEKFVPDHCGLSIEMAQHLRPPTLNETTHAAIQADLVNPITRRLDTLIDLGDRNSVKFEKKKIEDFQFISVLGRGNFGKVILAQEKDTKTFFAIKMLKKSFILENDEVESTRTEKKIFQLANQVKHPFLVNLHSCFQSENRLYFVMEYLGGGDLMFHVQHKKFTEKQVKLYAAEILLALEFLHKHEIIYRDLKLDNILLGLDGHIKLADYGLCKQDMGYSKKTGTFCGTPEFMAPEILIDEKYTRSVDWWAFGVLLYEMTFAQAPFKGTNEDRIFESILTQKVNFPLSNDITNLIQKLLVRDPLKRLGSSRLDAQEIKNHLYFRDVDFSSIYLKKQPAPFIPSVSGVLDVKFFDPEFTLDEPVLTPSPTMVHPSDQSEFSGFDYSCSK